MSGNTKIIPETFERSLARVRRLLNDAGLSISQEVTLASEPYFHKEMTHTSCVVLLVDTPALLFESIVLDRAAALFLPVHIVIGGDGEVSYVHFENPMGSAGLRPPALARIPLEKLCARIDEALSRLPEGASGQ